MYILYSLSTISYFFKIFSVNKIKQFPVVGTVKKTITLWKRQKVIPLKMQCIIRMFCCPMLKKWVRSQYQRGAMAFFMEGQGYLEKKCREFLVLLKPLILLNNIDKTFFNLQQKYLFLCLLQSELLPLVLRTAGGQSLLYILKEYVHTFHIHKFLSNWTIKLLFFF